MHVTEGYYLKHIALNIKKTVTLVKKKWYKIIQKLLKRRSIIGLETFYKISETTFNYFKISAYPSENNEDK